MDMLTLLEKLMKFAGEPAQKPGDQVRGTEKAKTKKSGEHPFKGRLVGDSKDNMLQGLSKLAEEKGLEWALQEAYQEFCRKLEEENLGVEEKRPLRKGSRPARDYGKSDEPSKRYKKVDENAEELNVGDDVIITGPVEHEGETGVIDSFGQDNRFVVVNLYNHGKKSFHSSDVSYNDYAGSDEEEAEMYDRDPEFRDWAARQEVDEGIEDDELSSQELRDRMKTAMAAHDEATADWGNPGFARHFGKTSLQNALNRKYGILKALKDKSLPLAQRLKFKELLSNVEREIEDLQVAESQGDPHKILMNKLRDIERKPSAPSADDDARRAEQAKADYAKYVAKMKKKDPNFVPLYKMDETQLGTVPTTQPNAPSISSLNAEKQKQQAQNVSTATTALKAATGAPAPTTSIAKAIDAATQGKAVSTQDMKVLQPFMSVIGQAAQNPSLAGKFKSLVTQATQMQQQNKPQ